VRNRERVLAAAATVLAEKGAEAGVPEIAERAGVGKGTVYRCFPTKEHLVAAVVIERVRWFTELTEAANRRPDAWTAFVGLLADLAEAQAGDSTFSEDMGPASRVPELELAKAELYAAIDRLMERARAEGQMRDGVCSRDVRILFGGTLRVLRSEGNRDRAEWRRCAGLVADAMRRR
jgi:AcrR family transcriptional regulator